MKSSTIWVLVALLGVFFGQEAQAFYNSSTGRWLSRDPIGERGGQNLYSAFRNKPESTIDPLGLIPPGSGPYPPQPRICRKCCCCVDGLSLGKVAPYYNSENFGYTFDVGISLSYIENSLSVSGCKMKWVEKGNIPYYKGKYPTPEKTDMFSVVPTSPTFQPWNSKSQPCPGSESLTITDTPGLITGNGYSGAHNLEFEITVESGNGCPCASRSKTVKAKMVLIASGGQPVWNESIFAILP